MLQKGDQDVHQHRMPCERLQAFNEWVMKYWRNPTLSLPTALVLSAVLY